jgi:outer membrane lipoprotein SlyB
MKRTGFLVVVAAFGLAACSSPSPRSADTSYPGSYPSTTSYPSQPASNDRQAIHYGYVESVEVVPASTQGPGVGAIGGAIAGGVLGNQVGSGSGRTAATVGGAVVGGVVGHKIEENVRGRQGDQYRFRVRLDDGSYQTYTQERHENIRVGDRVRVENGRVWPS